jgi:hypothetical protein
MDGPYGWTMKMYLPPGSHSREALPSVSTYIDSGVDLPLEFDRVNIIQNLN